MISRKDFLRTSFKAVFGSFAQIMDSNLPAELKEISQRILPPGAVAQFAEKCTSCGDCISACPADAIRLQPDEVADKELPVIIPSERACVMCDDRSCMRVCKAGALVLPADGEFPRMGLAVIQEDVCLAYTGSQCMTCFDACPLKRRAIQLRGGKPVVVEAHCTGCGVCEQLCVLTTVKGVEITPA